MSLKSPEGVCTVLFFGAEIQPKHLVFCYPWISPWFFVDFLLSPPPYAQSFVSFLVLADYFPWFLKSKQLLGFLGFVYMLKQGPNRNITFLFKYYQSWLYSGKEAIQTCQWQWDIVFAKKQAMSPPPPHLLLHRYCNTQNPPNLFYL